MDPSGNKPDRAVVIPGESVHRAPVPESGGPGIDAIEGKVPALRSGDRGISSSGVPRSCADPGGPLPGGGPEWEAPEEIRRRRFIHPSQARRRQNKYIGLIERRPEYIVLPQDVEKWRGRWQERFPVVQPLYVDLGSGRGHFLTKKAELERYHNFLGIEVQYKRLYLSAEKAGAGGLSNVQYVRYDVQWLDDVFVNDELSGVFINYPDPWPRARHEHRRMVSPALVRILERVVAPGGRVFLKSDWQPYREIILRVFQGSRFELTASVTDVGEWDRPEANVSTSYEDRFRRAGVPCFFYEFTLMR